MRKLSKYEKETIINWNEAENLATVYTFNASLKRRLADFSRKSVSYTHLATEEEIEHLEKNIKAMPSVTTMLEEGKSVRDMLELALAGFAPDILDSYHVTYKLSLIHI